MDIVYSKSGVPIRLTDERWLHITEEHSEMAGYYFEVLETVQDPEVVYQGMGGKYVPFKRIWYSYDEGADVLYFNFKKPSRADDSELTDEDIIVRYEKGEVVGLTVLHASRRKTTN